MCQLPVRMTGSANVSAYSALPSLIVRYTNCWSVLASGYTAAAAPITLAIVATTVQKVALRCEALAEPWVGTFASAGMAQSSPTTPRLSNRSWARLCRGGYRTTATLSSVRHQGGDIVGPAFQGFANFSRQHRHTARRGMVKEQVAHVRRHLQFAEFGFDDVPRTCQNQSSIPRHLCD